MIDSDEGIILLISHSKVLVNILEFVYGITLGLDVVTDLGSLDGLFDGSNEGKLYGLLETQLDLLMV